MRTLLETKRLGWALIFALVTAMGSLSYVSGERYLAAVAAVERVRAVETAVHATLTLLVDSETGHRGYLLTGDERFLEPLRVAERRLGPTLSELESLTRGDRGQAARVRSIRGTIEEKLDFIAVSDELLRSGHPEQAIARVRSGRGKVLMDRIRTQTRAMLDHESRLLDVSKSRARNAERLAVIGVGVGSIAMILVALFSLVTVGRDVDELKRAAEDLAASEQHYRVLTEQSSDLVRLLGIDGKVRYVSPSVERLLGYDVDEYMRLPGMSLLHPSEIDLAKSILADVMAGVQRSGISTYRMRRKDGEFRWFEVRWTAIRDDSGAVREIHTAASDVTERLAAEEQLGRYAEQLRTLSIRDELTGLYNRRGFGELAGRALAQTLRDGRRAALVFVDLNGMKRINDELGHEIGDQALVDAAHVLSSGMREGDVIARLGGDEFAVFALDFDVDRLEALRLRVRELADLRAAEQRRPFRLSMSLGAAYVDSATPTTLDELLKHSDAAMYEQKTARRDAGGTSVRPGFALKR